jgi:hypothetical protein
LKLASRARHVRPALALLTLGVAGCLVPEDAALRPFRAADAEQTADIDPPADATPAPLDAPVIFDGQSPADAGPDAGPERVVRPTDCAGPVVGRLERTGSSVEGGQDAGALVGLRLSVPDDALPEPVDVTATCVDRLVPEGVYAPLGPAVRVTAAPRERLGRNATLTLVYSAPDRPATVGNQHLRLFWKPDNYPYIAEPPLMDVIDDPVAGTFTFSTPALGTFQLGYDTRAGEVVERRYTFKAIGGISMGAGASAYLGTQYADRFDFILPLGGLTDQPYMMRYIRERLMGGFCREGQEGGVGTLCEPPRSEFAAEHLSDFNHWHYDDTEGSGGTFDRSEYVQIFQDLSYAYGNPLLYNPESPYLPPGTPSSDLQIPDDVRCAAECRGEACPPATASRTLPPGTFFDDEYNVDARFPVIAFCDGEDGDPRGDFDPNAAHRAPMEVAYAVDVNGNGRRDLEEPVIRNTSEPYDDVGCDGVASADEPGFDPDTNPDPDGDDFHWYRNPNGTERNWQYDACGMNLGEPYRDFGLDGVPDTPQFEAGGYDFGQGNGRFDYNPNFERFLARSPGTLFKALPPEERERLRFWADGGVRDIFNFAIDTAHLMGHLQAGGQNTRIYNDFKSLYQGISSPDVPFFPNPAARDAFGRRGQSVFLPYGNPDADAFAISQGDGAHVGSVAQALNRFMTMFEWVHNQWPNGDYAPVLGAFDREDGIVFFDSARFGKRYRYGISLPPGYGSPENADKRYPVLLILHGYGQGPDDLPVTGTILANQMAQGAWQKSIVVFPEGFCGQATQFQCNDGIDNDGDGTIDSTNDRSLRTPCETSETCVGTYTCRNGFCCDPAQAECGAPDETCGRDRNGRSESGEPVTMCTDGVDNDLDGLTDLQDEGCLNDPTQNTEADCKQGSFYTNHPARKDGTPGGPDFEGAMLDMLDHIDARYRTRRPEVLRVPR